MDWFIVDVYNLELWINCLFQCVVRKYLKPAKTLHPKRILQAQEKTVAQNFLASLKSTFGWKTNA